MADETLKQPLGSEFTKALTLACRFHEKQARKGTQIPYVAHLLAVASLALEHGATENEAIAAVLHDALEDHPANGETERTIAKELPAEVLAIVKGCSDGETGAERSKANWWERKQRYIAHVSHASRSVRLVSACDKLHNARAILSDYREHHEKLWHRFNGGRANTLTYYRALTDAFRAAAKHESHDGMRRLLDELDRVVTELHQEAAAHTPPAERL